MKNISKTCKLIYLVNIYTCHIYIFFLIKLLIQYLAILLFIILKFKWKKKYINIKLIFCNLKIISNTGFHIFLLFCKWCGTVKSSHIGNYAI